MRETLNVEYVSPAAGKKDKDERSLLDGCVGEVDKGAFQRAIRQHKAEETRVAERGERPRPPVTVPVRFVLSFPGSHVGFYPNWSFDRNDIEEQGILLPVKNLKLTKRVAVSAYTRKHLQHHELDIKEVFEKQVYYYTNSLARLKSFMTFVHPALGHAWLWSKESKTPSSDKLPVFFEARIYGADTIIPVYSKRFQGVVVQILARDILSGYNERMTSDLYLVSNTQEYVEYLDGVALEREQSSVSAILKSLRSFMTPRDYMELRAAKRAAEKKVVESETAAPPTAAAP